MDRHFVRSVLQYGMGQIRSYWRARKALDGIRKNAFECPVGASEQNPEKPAKTSEHPNTLKTRKCRLFAWFHTILRPTSEQKRQKRARTRAECITIPMTGPQIMPLTLWGAGGFRHPLPPKARPNRLQTRQGEKTARWCTWAYIEGESSMPNAVSSDLARFERPCMKEVSDVKRI